MAAFCACTLKRNDGAELLALDGIDLGDFLPAKTLCPRRGIYACKLHKI